jgi:hypothetical protein
VFVLSTAAASFCFTPLRYGFFLVAPSSRRDGLRQQGIVLLLRWAA